ncbi:MAG: hypothetical protein JXL97_07020 [Bacteroidales bacterium]|nr:hypothetical protein [Bacteroidales bacterium]
MKKNIFWAILFLIFFIACDEKESKNSNNFSIPSENIVHKVKLEEDLTEFSNNEKLVIKLLIRASMYNDSMFFYENISNFKEIYSQIKDQEKKELFVYNFGPWDRFNENKPFIEGFGEKPSGANFYPNDITVEEFQNYPDNCKNSLYTFIRRNQEGELYCVPYNVQFKTYIDSISVLLLKAAELTDSPEFSEYLIQRSKDIKTDNYFKSDSLWVRLQYNKLDYVFGPIQILDDCLFNLKAEHQSFLLVKDEVWSEKMHKYNKWLRFLQKAIPVPEEYRAEEPGSNSSISVYDIIFFGGSATAGGTLISVVLPLESQTQITQGVKNLQFKNIMESKFDAVLKPISDIVLTDLQKEYISSEAFFVNTILYEMANSLGIRNTINGNGTVRNALKDYYTTTSHIKNYALSLFLAEKLYEVSELSNDLKENYLTFVVDLLRRIRFGLNNEYAKSNIVFYNYLVENKAIKYDKNNHIMIDYNRMKTATESLTNQVIIMQGNGDYSGVKAFVDEHLYIDEKLYNLIISINNNNIPTDIEIVQGEDVLKF